MDGIRNNEYRNTLGSLSSKTTMMRVYVVRGHTQ